MKKLRYLHISGVLNESSYNADQLRTVSFAEYFLKFYRKPFNNLSATSHGRMDAEIRFESISQDFKEVRKIIGLDSSEELVRINMTAQKNGYEQYYLDVEAGLTAGVNNCFLVRSGHPIPPHSLPKDRIFSDLHQVSEYLSAE